MAAMATSKMSATNSRPVCLFFEGTGDGVSVCKGETAVFRPSFRPLYWITAADILSNPPRLFAKSIKTCVAFSVPYFEMMSANSSSFTWRVNPSEQSKIKSPFFNDMGKMSICGVFYEPKLYKITFFRGCVSASSSVIAPSSTNLATRLWSFVIWRKSPLRQR